MAAEPSHILIVGRPERRSSLLQWMTAAGYRVLMARSDAQAMAWLSAHAIDAILYLTADPGRRTLRFLDRLRARKSDACVVVAGPDAHAERTARLMKAGAFDYLAAPIGKARVLASLEQGLETRRSFIQVRALSDKLRASNDALARERDALQHWNHSLVSLNRLNQAVAGTVDADEIVRMTQAYLREWLPYGLLGIMWCRPERVWMDAPEAPGRRSVAEVRRALIEQGQRLGTASLAGTPPASCQETAATVDLLVRAAGGATDVVEIPLVSGRSPLGLLRLECRSGRYFQPVDVELLKTLAMSLALALRNAEAHTQLQNLAMTDGLTNLLNRRAFTNVLGRVFRESARYGIPSSLILADIDFFKQINDRQGHVTGDHVLKEVASLISQSLRAVDVAARYGGEEFAVILPRTDTAPSAVLANRIRERVAQHVFVGPRETFHATISLGIASVPCVGVSMPEELIVQADTALYRAKSLGRNRAEIMERTGVPAASAARAEASDLALPLGMGS